MERSEIEGARRKQGLTYQELADKCGLSVSTVQRYCQGGVKSPSVEVTQALSRVLGEGDNVVAETCVCNNDENSVEKTIAALRMAHEDELTRAREESRRYAEMIVADKDEQIKRIRTEKYVCAALAITVTALMIGLFIYDYSHPDRGWIRYGNASTTAQVATQ